MRLKTLLLALPGTALLAATNVNSSAADSPPSITLQPIGTYHSGVFGQGAAEIVAHDPFTQRLYVVNAQAATVDVLSLTDPGAPQKVATIDVTPYGAVANSVAVRDGIIAVAVENAVKTEPGSVAFFDLNHSFLASVQVGALPDMLTFTPNGHHVLVVNEGEPNSDYSVDPEGSVSVIDVSGGIPGLTQANVRTANFQAFNGVALDSSIRIFGPGASVTRDIEPEYLTVSHDSKTAWVTCQENNAIATIDIESATVTHLAGLGFKDHLLPGNGLDASDRDNAINITHWPLKGMYLPDTIASYKVGSTTFLVMANEGDAREYETFDEQVRIGSGAVQLDTNLFPNATALKNNANLGRLRITSTLGRNPNTGLYEALYSFGGRSFSIRTPDGALVFDSGDAFEVVTAAMYPTNFNASNSNNLFDDRSDDKGPEPEGLALGKVFGRTYAFIGLERIGGVMVYDVTDPFAPFFVDYSNFRDFSAPVESPGAGDLGPEGLILISAENSPNGRPLLVVGNEVSGTTTVYEIGKRK